MDAYHPIKRIMRLLKQLSKTSKKRVQQDQPILDMPFTGSKSSPLSPARSQTSAFVSLPFEILLMIFDLFIPPPSMRRVVKYTRLSRSEVLAYSSLLSLSLTCKAILPAARVTLYTYPCFMRTGQEGQFLESLRSNDDLRQLVKRMDFWDLNPGWKELRRVHCALLALCDLEFVTLVRPHPVDGAETAWSMLVSRSHQLRSLKVTFGTMPFTQVAGDLVRFANLELLDLEADTPSFIDQDVTLPKEQPSFKLAELRLKQCDSFQRVISWMLTKTSREASLRKLDLHIDKGRCPDWLWAFHSLPVLRDLSQFSLTLSLNGIPTRDNPPLSLRFLDDEDLLHLPELLSMLPPHLSHLTLAAPGGSAFFVPNILREILEESGVQAKILELKCTSFPSLWENEARKDFLDLMREAQTEVGERTGGSVKWWVGDEQIDLRFDVSLPI